MRMADAERAARLRISGWMLRRWTIALNLGETLRLRSVRRAVLEGERPRRLVDLGAGQGTLLLGLSRLVDDSLGIELDPLEASRAHIAGATNVIRGDITRLGLSSDAFDVVTATDVIEHVDDDEAALDEIARIVAPGGRVIISTPTDDFFIDEEYESFGHVRTGYLTADLTNRLERRGLVVDETGYFKSSSSRKILRWTRRPSLVSHLFRSWASPVLLPILAVTERRGDGFYNLFLVAHKPITA